jgi:hypothetical protein
VPDEGEDGSTVAPVAGASVVSTALDDGASEGVDTSVEVWSVSDIQVRRSWWRETRGLWRCVGAVSSATRQQPDNTGGGVHGSAICIRVLPQEHTMADKAFLERLTKELADQGRLIEAGWVAMRVMLKLHNAPPDQLDAMRFAYMAGAQHLFSSIITMLDPGVEETPGDMHRMDLIHKELGKFQQELQLRASQAQGTA